MEWIERDRGDAFARSAGAALIVEAALLAVTRILTLVYTVARDVNAPDEVHTPKTVLLSFALVGITIVTILVCAGGQLRRTPAGAWRAAGPLGRLDLAVAGVLNGVIATWAVGKLVSPGSLGGESIAAWVLTGVVALVVVAGLVRDAAGRARPTAER